MRNTAKTDYIVYALGAENMQLYCTKMNTTQRGVKTAYGKLTRALTHYGCLGGAAVESVKQLGYCPAHKFADYNGEVDLIGYKDYLKANRKPRTSGVKKLHFYSDPAHGWLKVGIGELERLGIADKITPCSYVRGQYAYLEEDCDAPLYMKAYKEAHGGEVKFELEEHTTNGESRIRNYDSYPSVRY